MDPIPEPPQSDPPLTALIVKGVLLIFGLFLSASWMLQMYWAFKK